MTAVLDAPPAPERDPWDELEDLVTEYAWGRRNVMPRVRKLAHRSLAGLDLYRAWLDFYRLTRERDELALGDRHWCESFDLEALEGYGDGHQDAAIQRKAAEADEAMALLRLGNIRGD